MSSNCPECAGVTAWDDFVCSAVCTSCGTLTDPSQSLLTSQYDFSEGPSRYSGWDINSGRRAHFSSWTLSDQSKEARDKRNSAAILEFIESLARSLNATGLSPRAMNLFLQAKESVQFRWGQKAKLVAGACLGIALRESNRPDCLRDISYLLEETHPTISRVFISVTSALKLSLGRVETSSYIPILREHLSSLLKNSSDSIPANLTRDLSSVPLNAVSTTATCLGDIFARIGTPTIIQRSTPAIACALFILSLESELRTTIKHLAPLAQTLGGRLNVGKGVVMSCYTATQDALSSLVENVPWLDKYEPKNGRAKVAKRNVVARATKDIVAFYNSTWKATEKPRLEIISEDGTRLPDQDVPTCGDGEKPNRPRKRRKVHKATMQFLLDPVTGPLPSLSQVPSKHAASSAPQQLIHPLLIHYLSSQGTSQESPTRLQLLASSRGGADYVSDSELFEEDEMESLMRTEEEMKVIAHMCGWEDTGEEAPGGQKLATGTKPRTSSEKYKYRQHQDFEPEKRRSRINLDALAKFMNNEDGTQDNYLFSGFLDSGDYDRVGEGSDSEVENSPPSPRDTRLLSSTSSPRTPTDEIIIEDWRPTSPGRGNTLIDDRYDEVYD